MRCAAGTPVEGKVNSVREIDWCNIEFPDGWTALRAGQSEVHEYMEMGGMHDTYIKQLIGLAFGDIDGDGRDEAVLLISEENYYTSGSSSRGASMYLFELRAGRPALKTQEWANAADRMSVKVEGDAVVQVADTHTRGRCTLRWRPYAKTPKDRGNQIGQVSTKCASAGN